MPEPSRKFNLTDTVYVIGKLTELGTGVIVAGFEQYDTVEDAWVFKYAVRLQSNNITQRGEEYLTNITRLTIHPDSRLYLFTENELEAVNGIRQAEGEIAPRNQQGVDTRPKKPDATHSS